MVFKYTCLYYGFMIYAILLVSGQEIDLNELATTLSLADIPVRVPPSHFIFSKDRSPSTGVSTRIIGGGVATAHEYPYQVALYVYVGTSLYFCGGSLIKQQWVLTAAHCVEDSTQIIIILGSHELNVEETTRVVYNSSSYIIHESWDSELIQYDIALIKLPESVTLNTYISTIPIAQGNDSYNGLTSRCLGWGRTVLGTLSNILRYVDADVITNEACKAYEEYQPYIVDHHLCTSGVGVVGSCNGDSGGPLIINGTQVGLVSFGYTDCTAGYPSVYTRLTEFSTWVEEKIEKYTQSSSTNAIIQTTVGNVVGYNGTASKMGSLFNIYVKVLLSIAIINYL